MMSRATTTPNISPDSPRVPDDTQQQSVWPDDLERPLGDALRHNRRG